MNSKVVYPILLILFHFYSIFAQSDIALSVTNLTPIVAANDSITVVITLHNEGKTFIKDIKVMNILPYGIKYITHFTEKGHYDPIAQIWSVADIKPEQNNISMTLLLKIGEDVEGIISLLSEIIEMSEKDVDSTPGNGSEDLALLEDDIKFYCVSVPLLFDLGSKINVTINANNSYRNYEWYKNGKKIDGAIDSSYTATDFGHYTIRVIGTKSSPDCELIFSCPFIIAPKNSKSK